MGFFSRKTPDLSEIKDLERTQNERVREILKSLERLETEIENELQVMQGKVETNARSVRLMAEEMDERIDRGNKVWRRIRAKESRDAERREIEGEEEPSGELPLFDAPGGQPEGVRPMYGDMGGGGQALQPHQIVARQIARNIAGGH